MYALEFENRITLLIPGLDSEAIKSIVAYAVDLDRDGVCSLSEFFKTTYVEFGWVKQHYGNEIACRLFNIATVFTFRSCIHR